MTVLNRTVFDIPLTWNRTRFQATRNKYRFARKLIETSIIVQYEKQMRGIFSHNIEIEENINDINEHLLKYYDKLRVLDNMIELASQSLRIYFDKRMESIRQIINEHCNIIQQIIFEEAEHWKEIHAVMNQNLLNPGDIRSRNNYPRGVQKSPASNINTIEEEIDDDNNNEEHVSKLLNSKTLTPLLTQMIRKSRLQSNRLTIVPSVKIQIPIQQENFSFKKEECSIHILPLSAPRQPLEIVDTTFVVKPDETIIDGELQNDNNNYDEPNGTYRAPHEHCYSHLRINQPETSLIDSQPHIPARLCFSPTILQDATISSEINDNEQTLSSSNNENFNKILSSIDQNQINSKKSIEDPHRFGQTFLLDNIKTENLENDHNKYIRPAIPDDDILVVVDTNSLIPSSEQISHIINDKPTSKLDPPIQQESITVPEIVPPKSRTRKTTKTRSKPVIVSARKTRSAAKVIAEREAAAAAAAVVAKPTTDKPIETKRKARKRKQSKAIDHSTETSDDENENPQSNSTRTIIKRRKTRKRRKSKTDNHSQEISNDNNDNLLTNNKQKSQKRSKSKRNDDQQENSDNEEKKSKIIKRKQKTKKTNKDNDEQISTHHSTQSSTKRNPQPT